MNVEWGVGFFLRFLLLVPVTIGIFLSMNLALFLECILSYRDI